MNHKQSLFFANAQNKGIVGIFVLILILVVAVAGGAYYLGKSSSTQPTSVVFQPSPTPSPSDEAVNWRTFASKNEGFTLHYPPDWTIEDTSSGNCGHTKLNGTDCRERFDFVAPDRLRVGFVVYTDDNSDQGGCGIQGPCEIQDVKNLEMLNISTLGQVYLVSYISNYGGLFNNIALHKPVDSRTIPVLGENKHSDYSVDFSLPSKTGGRFKLDVFTNTAENQNSKWTGMSYEQFYNSDSVKKAILILKSLSY